MQSLTLQLKGLYTHPSEIGSDIPAGALSVADNIVIDKESVAQPRRGFSRQALGFSNPAYRANNIYFYKNKLLAHYSTNLMAYYDAGWNQYSGTYTAPANGDSSSDYATLRVRATEANQNLYLTTSVGIKKLDDPTSTPIDAGAVKALDIQATIPVSDTAAWLTDDYRVAYRVIWGYKDANNNLILGTPSQRESIKNTSGSISDVQLAITTPDGVDENWFFQVYRSASYDNTVEDIEPNDELGLVYEANPTTAEITAKLVTVIDITPDELRGATIYTASTQEGLVNGNERPPLAKDIAVFKNTLFYANTVSKHRYYLTLLAADGTNGIAEDDTITIGGVVYTGAATEDITAREFQVFTTGSASQNIRDTSLSLIRVINRNASSVINAFYLSGPDDLPGKILLEEESLGGAAFPVISIRASVGPTTVTECWSPALPISGTTQSSTNDAFKNAIFYSKPSQPEAVPLANFFFAGSAQGEILRILPLRDSLFILKTDGIYRISGEDNNSFRVDSFDATTKLIGAETAVVLNNQIFALTDQGVVAITEGGVQVKSRPIEVSLLSLIGEDLDALRNLSFAVSYETERKYILFVPSLAGDTTPTQAYVYNTFTNTWTRWTLTKKCGAVNPDTDMLYLGDATSNYVNVERKTLSFTDQVDFGSTVTISAVDDNVLTVSTVEDIDVGDVIYQSAIVFSTVESKDIDASTVTVTYNAAFTAASADILKAIDSKIGWVPFTGGNPGVLKQFREATLLFKKDFSGDAFLVFASDASGSPETETISGTSNGLWGLFTWGQVAWGGVSNRRPIRVFVPRNKQRCSQLTIEFRHAVGFASYQLNGISVIANPGSERVAR